MSKLHVTQIGGYLQAKLAGIVDVSDYVNHSDAPQIEKAFLTRALTALAISNLTEAKLENLASNITDGSHDGGIDGIYFDPDERTLYLVQAKWHDDGNGSIEKGEALKFLDGIGKVLNNDLSGLNARIQKRQQDIQSALYDANAKFMLVIAHTGQQSLASDVEEVLTRFVDAQNDTSELVKLRILSQAELHKAVSAGVAGAPISLEIQLTSWGQIREPHVAFYGQVCASDVAAWVEAHGNRLFSANIRQFLGTSAVNDDIVTTLKSRPQDFWYLNNGITAIVAHVAKKPIGGNSSESGIFECTGFNVVNGAQTVGSIHAASQTASEQVAKAMVGIRIISTSESTQDFGTDVTRCTNTQNAIAKRDFVALDPEQERIRQELQFNGIEYTYKAGAASGPTPSRFDLTEATIAQACSSTQVDMAVQAKREIGRLWDDISKSPYKVLFNAGVSGPFLWERVQALRSIETELQAASKAYGGRESLICIHGNRFIEWLAMQRLALKQGDKFSLVVATVPSVVRSSVSDVISAVMSKFPESYPASLFKNATKCRELAAAIPL